MGSNCAPELQNTRCTVPSEPDPFRYETNPIEKSSS